MSYKPIHNFRVKDKLNPGDPDKIIYGADLQDEFDAIADHLDILSHIDIDGDGNINIPPELIDGLVEALGDKADQVDLEAEIAARIAGDQNLQSQIDALGGGGASSWDEITGKPSEYPPASHEHSQSDIDGLEDRLDQIEDSITSGGGFVDAPNDGALYGRQSEDWAEIVIPEAEDPDWSDIQNKPDFDATYAPVSHGHEISDVNGLQDALDNAGEAGGLIVISETEPDQDDRVTGMQWMDVGGTEPHVWVWDQDKWVELPAGGYDDTEVKALIADNTAAIGTKLDADTIWTGTEAEYNALTPDADTLYFIV